MISARFIVINEQVYDREGETFLGISGDKADLVLAADALNAKERNRSGQTKEVIDAIEKAIAAHRGTRNRAIAAYEAVLEWMDGNE